MSKTRSFKRHLNPQKVWLANKVAKEKLKIARQVVLERAKKDVVFAADVLKAVGDALPKEIKEACEASVNSASIAEADKMMVESLINSVREDKRKQLDDDAMTHSIVQKEEPKAEKLPVVEAFDKYPKDSKVKGW